MCFTIFSYRSAKCAGVGSAPGSTAPVAKIALAAGERRQCSYQWDENPPASVAINNRIETYKLLISQFMTCTSGLFSKVICRNKIFIDINGRALEYHIMVQRTTYYRHQETSAATERYIPRRICMPTDRMAA